MCRQNFGFKFSMVRIFNKFDIFEKFNGFIHIDKFVHRSLRAYGFEVVEDNVICILRHQMYLENCPRHPSYLIIEKLGQDSEYCRNGMVKEIWPSICIGHGLATQNSKALKNDFYDNCKS